MDKVGYIDEYGDKSIDYQKQGVSIYFIVTAVIVDRDKIPDVEYQINQLVPRFTNSPEVKSNSKSFRKIEKRIAFLKEISALDFNIYSVIVDKRKIFEESGLRFRDVFFKYVNGLLDADLYRYYPYLELVADEHGSDKFMNGFINYVKEKHFQTELFREPKFRYGDSKAERLIQIADFVSGTLSRCYDPDKRIDNPNQIIDILEPRILHLREWPEIPIQKFKGLEDEDDAYSHEIASFVLNIAHQFIKENEHKKEENIKNQLICLHYLIFRFRNHPYSYVYSDEIIRRINERNVQIQKRTFSKEVIGKLREYGVLIVSSQNGYKIPCSKGDIIRFFNNYNTKILPMLQTLEHTNKLVRTATDGLLNLFEYDEFKTLENIIKIIKKPAGNNS